MAFKHKGSKGKVKVEPGALYVTGKKGNKKPVNSLSEALYEESKCGCGIDCHCCGILTLPNWDSATGESEIYGMMIIDGAMVVDTKDNLAIRCADLKALRS